MTQDYDASARQEWLDRLDEDRLSSALETIARLPSEQRRTALSDPVAYLEKEGLRPPPGIEVKLLDKQLDPAGFPDLPRLPELQSFPELLHRFPICFQVCTLEPWIVRGRMIGFKRVCRLVCILV